MKTSLRSIPKGNMQAGPLSLHGLLCREEGGVETGRAELGGDLHTGISQGLSPRPLDDMTFCVFLGNKVLTVTSSAFIGYDILPFSGTLHF